MWKPFLVDGDTLYCDISRLEICGSTIAEELDAGKDVIVHCGKGGERSPFAVAYYLSKFHGMSMSAAYECLRKNAQL